MAKNVTKAPMIPTIDNLKDTIGKKQEQTLTRTLTPEQTPTLTPTPTPTPAPKKELKTKRLQLVLRESTVTKLGQYAEKYGTSRNDVVQKLLDNLLENE